MPYASRPTKDVGRFGVPRVPESRIETYLRVLGETGSMNKACKAARLTYRQVKRWEQNSPKFVDAVEEARYHYACVLEEAAHQRAVEGVLEPVYYKGEVCGHKRKYSDSLLTRMLEANVPKYKDSVAGSDVTAQVIVTPALAHYDSQLAEVIDEQARIVGELNGTDRQDSGVSAGSGDLEERVEGGESLLQCDPPEDVLGG